MLTSERPVRDQPPATRPPAPERAARRRGAGKPPKPPKMGRQPGLDGIRTFSVGMVVLHHAEIVHRQVFGPESHHEIITGGFVFPEMFFVMSGFLITTIMLQEREGTGTFSMKGFYARRARRLLPGLWVMVAAAILWATFFGYIALEGRPGAERYHLSEMRWSTVATLLMGQNWHMIFSGNGYFGGFPDLFRHIWSLSIDEQFYIFFPLVLVALYGGGRHFDLHKLVRFCVPLIVVGWVVMAATYRAPEGGDLFGLNFAYLSTITRMPGILIGVVLACIWRPWTWNSRKTGHLPLLDLIGLGSFALIMFIGLTAHNEAWYVYRGLFPIVSVLAAMVAAMVVHPGAVYTRAFFGNKVISGIGQRAFGIYLWHWPLFAGPLATASFGTKLAVGLPLTALFAELSYRFIETPFRDRAIGKWREKVRRADWEERQMLVRPVAIVSVGVIFLVSTMAVRLATAEDVDITSDGGVNDLAVDTGDTGEVDEVDDLVAEPVDTAPDPGQVSETTAPGQVVVPTTKAPATGKVRLAIVGSSQAVMLGKNLPASAKKKFTVAKGGRSGCTIFSQGRIEGHRRLPDGTTDESKVFKWGFSKPCKNWLSAWTEATDSIDAEVVLVVTGGWEVFDLILPDRTLKFASPEFDEYYLAQLQKGIDAVKKRGAKVALLEVPCLRPVDDPGAGVPPLAERWDDSRTGHISDLFRRAAANDPEHVFFVENADEWCTTPRIAESKAYRFDGVHVLGLGAKLTMDAITPRLLEIARG